MAVKRVGNISVIRYSNRKSRSVHASYPRSDPRHNNSIRIRSNTFKMATGKGHPYNPSMRLNLAQRMRERGTNSRTSVEREVSGRSKRLGRAIRSVNFVGNKKASTGHSGG